MEGLGDSYMAVRISQVSNSKVTAEKKTKCKQMGKYSLGQISRIAARLNGGGPKEGKAPTFLGECVCSYQNGSG
jgi:hypothetical protein